MQRDLFPDTDPPPHVRGSATSLAAAGEIEPRAATLRRLVLDFLRSRGAGGATDEEGIDATGLSPSTYRPRRIECCNDGLVIDSGRTRAVRSGRQAVVWAATPPRHLIERQEGVP